MRLGANTCVYCHANRCSFVFPGFWSTRDSASRSALAEKKGINTGGIKALHVVGGLAKSTNKLLKLLENDEIDV